MNYRYFLPGFLSLLYCVSHSMSITGTGTQYQKEKRMNIVKGVAIVGGTGLATFVAVPVIGGAALSLVGFTVGGIAAGSYAASLMSSSAVAAGGGVAAGSLVAGLQSAGVLGVGSGVSAAVGALHLALQLWLNTSRNKDQEIYVHEIKN